MTQGVSSEPRSSAKPEDGEEKPDVVKVPSRQTVKRSRWGAGRIIEAVTGVLLGLVSFVFLGAGGTGLWAQWTQRDGGYVTTDVHRFSTPGSALVTEPTTLGSADTGWLYAPGVLGNVRIRVTSRGSQGPVFVGIGPTRAVDQYLAGVDRTVISDFWGSKVQSVSGGAPNTAPGSQHFWVASATGTGQQTLRWTPVDGTWSVVVMNTNGRPGVHVGADLGARIPALPWVAVGFLLAGAVFLVGGILLTWGAIRRPASAGTATEADVQDGYAGSAERNIPDPGEPPSHTREVNMMATPTITTRSLGMPARAEIVADRYEGIQQYSLAKILAVWSAAALPMGVLAWIVAPALKDNFSGTGTVPMLKALVPLLTVGLLWECVLAAGLVWHEQRTLRWSVVRNALWLRSPRSPSTGRVGGRLWLLVVPLTMLFALGGFVPTFSTPANRDLATWIGTESGKHFMHGNWGWYAALLLMFVANIIGEELLFRGVLLPRMKGVFGRNDWLANAILFTTYHLHEPWLMPGTFVCDTLAYVYPSRRYQSTWIGITVHGSQTLFFGALLLALVLR